MSKIQPTILVVDDEYLNYLVAAGLLEDITTKVFWAAGSLDAIKFASENHVDVVLMDGHMPGMHGAAATEKIIAIKPHLKIIATTADQNLKNTMLEAGCVDFLLKPIEFERLMVAISTALVAAPSTMTGRESN